MFILPFSQFLRSTYIVRMVNHYYPKYSELLNDRSQRILAGIVNQERYAERPIGELSLRTFLSSDVLVTSQGVKECMSWRGQPLYKSVYDFSLFPIMIWDIQPKTIIEIGSGNGNSAIWMDDICKMYEIDCHIHSMDLQKAKIRKRKSLTFLEGDSNNIEKVFDDLSIYPHPWMIIEDAHVNVTGVVNWFTGATAVGDYVIIEDIRGSKIMELNGWKSQRTMMIDRHYMDYFGPNATSSLILAQR